MRKFLIIILNEFIKLKAEIATRNVELDEVIKMNEYGEAGYFWRDTCNDDQSCSQIRSAAATVLQRSPIFSTRSNINPDDTCH